MLILPNNAINNASLEIKLGVGWYVGVLGGGGWLQYVATVSVGAKAGLGRLNHIYGRSRLRVK